MEIKEGSYLTRDGTHASVWAWGKNMLGEECWTGTVKGGGFNCWDTEGRDISGTTEWDLVALMEASGKGEEG